MEHKTQSTPLLNQAVKNSVFLGLGTISATVLGFLFAGLTLRYLGIPRGGYIMLVSAVLALNSLVGGFGLGTPAVARVATLHAKGDLSTARIVVGSVATINTASGVFFALLIVFSFPFVFEKSQLDIAYKSDAFIATIFIAAAFLIGQAASGWQNVYQSLQRYDLVAVLTTIFSLLSSVSCILILRAIPLMTALAVTQFVIQVIRLSCDAYLMKRLLNRVPLPTWNWSEVRPMLGFGGWAYLGTLGRFLFMNVDRLILASFLGSSALPYYAVPQQLYAKIHGTLAAQSEFLFPMLSSFGEAARVQIERLEDRLRWFMALISGTAYVSLAFFGPPILSMLVGPDFAKKAMIPLILVCIQGFCHAQMIVPYMNSWAVRRGAPNTVAQLMNGTLVALSAVVLIPRLGYVGASVAQLWICIVALVHTLAVSHILYPKGRRWEWIHAYASPLCFIVVWLLIVKVANLIFPNDPAWLYGSVLLGGIIGMGTVWLTESFLFPKYERWATLMSAITIVLKRVKINRIILGRSC